MAESYDNLNARFRRYASYYSKLYDEMKLAEDFYQGRFEVPHPANIEARIPPTARTRLDVAVTELVTESPRVFRRRSHHTERQKTLDDKIELALQAFLLDSEEYLETPTLHEAGKLQFRRGMAVLLGPLVDISSGNARVYYEALDPLTVYLEPGSRPREGFLHCKVTVAEMEQLAEQYKIKGFSRGDRSDVSQVTLVQWFRKPSGKEAQGTKAVWIAEEEKFLLAPQLSKFRYLPLEPIYSGWGTRVMGAKPEEAVVGLLNSGTRALLADETELFTLLMGATRKAVWGHWMSKEGVPEGFEIEFSPGSITHVPFDLEPFPHDPLPTEVGSQFNLVQAMLDDTLATRMLAGQRQPGVSTATGIQILTNRAKKRFDPPLRLMQAGVSRLLYKIGLLTETLAELGITTLSWRGFELTNDMYQGDYSVEVDLGAEDEDERRVRAAEGMALEGKIPREYIWRDYYNIENTSEAYKQWIKEKILDSPAFIDSIIQMYGIQLSGRKAEASKKMGDMSQQYQRQMGPGTGLDRLASIFRAAKGGFMPAQPGTLEGITQEARQTARVPAVPGLLGGV